MSARIFASNHYGDIGLLLHIRTWVASPNAMPESLIASCILGFVSGKLYVFYYIVICREPIIFDNKAVATITIMLMIFHSTGKLEL